MSALYSILKMIFRLESVTKIGRSNIPRLTEHSLVVTLEQSAGRKASLPEFHNSPPISRRILPSHVNLVFMKSQLG